jgi:hypothetical protein
MDTKTKLNESLKDAMKSGDERRKLTIRMVLAAVKQVEIDRRASVDEAGVISILQKEIKNRREALDEAKKASRADLAGEAETEIAILSAFLPQGLGVDELKALVEQAIRESGALGPADMGKVMKTILPKVTGRAPGDQVSALVRELLPQK